MGHSPRYQWKVFEGDRQAALNLARELDVPPIIGSVLMARGYCDTTSARGYLQPSLDSLSAPSDLTDLDKAAHRIRQAQEEGEHVLVFGDYDVDGISGTAILVRALRRAGIAQCSYDLPNRLTHGYGIKEAHVQEAHACGVSLIVTVDNGSSAPEALAAARGLGIDVVVTDHHHMEPDAAGEAYAVVNPSREPMDHPAKRVCGAGVAFKVAQALTGEYLDADLAALGTVADVVPLQGENRCIAAAGLSQMAKLPKPGITALARESRTSLSALKAEALAFQLCPRINAGGRLGDGKTGLELLLTEDERKAEGLARGLNRANEERRQIEDQILRQVERHLEKEDLLDRSSIVLASRRWHPGVIGIVAARLQRRHNRPVTLVAFDESGVGRGSARGVDGCHLTEALACCNKHLVAYGGHAAAAGLTIHEPEYRAFQECFESAVAQALPNGAAIPSLDIDAQLGLGEIDSQLLKMLELFEPCGHQNPAPLFAAYGVEVLPGSRRTIKEKHFKMSVRQESRPFEALGWNMADRLPEISEGAMIDVAFAPQFNTFRGETRIQLNLKDFRPSSG